MELAEVLLLGQSWVRNLVDRLAAMLAEGWVSMLDFW